MRAHGALRLVPVVALAWATASATTMIPDASSLIAGILWLAAVAGLAVAALRGGRRVVVAVLAVAAAAVVASHVALAQPARVAAADPLFDGGRAVAVHAQVTGKVERWSDGSLVFDAVAAHAVSGDRRVSLGVPVQIQVAPDDVGGSDDAGGTVAGSAGDVRAALDVGARIVARGTVGPADPGDRAVLEVRARRGVAVVSAPEGILAASAGLRQGLVATAAKLPGPGAGLVPGLAVGDTSAVLPELDDAMKESSLSHLTAVSGANCALVVGLAFLVASGLGAPRGARVVAGLVVLAGFVVLVTPEPSVVRAATMASIAMIAVLIGRPGVGMAVLCLAVVVLLAIDPWLAGSLGFALSAAATASLLLFARPIATGLERRLPRVLALGLAVPLAAQLACGPLLVLIKPSVPVYGVVANLLAAPAAPVATIVGLAACLTAPLPWLPSALAAIAWVPASWIASTAQTTAALPGDQLPWMEGWPGAAALAVVGLAVGAVIALRPRRGGARAVARASAVVLLALVAGIGSGSALVGGVAGRLTLPAEWAILVCDVGQGDAVLLRSGAAVALVDTGPDAARLDECLSRAGIGRIDLLVLTHFDLDHVGGVDAVAGRVGTVLHGPTVEAADDRMLAGLRSTGARSVRAEEGMTGRLGEARWSVLWPRAESAAFPGGNDASVVLDVRGGGLPPTLLLGDLSASPQRAVTASDRFAPPYAVVKTAHHGSADQHHALYSDAAPALALVTVGADNDYGHPRSEILDHVGELGATIARTDTEGMIAVSIDDGGDGLAVWRERVGGGG